MLSSRWPAHVLQTHSDLYLCIEEKETSASMMIGVGFRRQGNQGEKTELLQPARERNFSDSEECEMPFSRSWKPRKDGGWQSRWLLKQSSPKVPLDGRIINTTPTHTTRWGGSARRKQWILDSQSPGFHTCTTYTWAKENPGQEVRSPGYYSQSCHLLAVGHWASPLSSVGFCCPICKLSSWIRLSIEAFQVYHHSVFFQSWKIKTQRCESRLFVVAICSYLLLSE